MAVWSDSGADAAPADGGSRRHGAPGARAGRRVVAVELDAGPWRVVPLEAVLVAGLTVGGELDRQRARLLRRELRRLEARDVALGPSLAAITRGVARTPAGASAERHRSCATRRSRRVERAGLVDDARFAASRAALLAARGAGDAMIEDDLARKGVPAGRDPRTRSPRSSRSRPGPRRSWPPGEELAHAPPARREGVLGGDAGIVYCGSRTTKVRIGRASSEFHLHRALSRNDQATVTDSRRFHAIRATSGAFQAPSRGNAHRDRSQHDRSTREPARAGGVRM